MNIAVHMLCMHVPAVNALHSVARLDWPLRTCVRPLPYLISPMSISICFKEMKNVCFPWIYIWLCSVHYLVQSVYFLASLSIYCMRAKQFTPCLHACMSTYVLPLLPTCGCLMSMTPTLHICGLLRAYCVCIRSLISLPIATSCVWYAVTATSLCQHAHIPLWLHFIIFMSALCTYPFGHFPITLIIWTHVNCLNDVAFSTVLGG